MHGDFDEIALFSLDVGFNANEENSPETVEAIVRTVYCQNGSSGISFRHPPVPLQDDHFGPDLVVDLGPFVQHLLNVVLEQRAEFYERNE